MVAGFFKRRAHLKKPGEKEWPFAGIKSGKQHIKRVETWFKSNIENELGTENRVAQRCSAW